MKSSIFTSGAIAAGIYLRQVALLITALMVSSGQSVKATEVETPSPPESQQRVRSGKRSAQQPATTVDEWLAQIAPASVIQITGVQLNSTETGIELLLETLDELATPETLVSGNTLTADIPNAVLALPDGEEFSALEPTVGISQINVTNLPNNRVRVVITGTDGPPVVDLRTGVSGLVLGIVSEEIEIVVTQQQSGERYLVPNATTGTRTDTPVLDTPQSIQVIPQRILEDQQILEIDDALRNVSGFNGEFDAFGVGTGLTLRGFSTEILTRSPVLRDGFRVYNTLGGQETANLERIEVLKGPSSVLYGANEPGGVINLVTKQPLFEPFYELEFQAGRFGFIRPRLDFSGPLTEDKSLRYRLNLAYQREDGFRDFETDFNRFFIAPVLSWDISDRTTLSVSLEYLDEEAPFYKGLLASGERVVDVPFDRFFDEPNDVRRSQSLTAGYNLEHQLSDNWTLKNAFRYVEQNYDVQAVLPAFFNEATGILNRVFAIREYRSDDYSVQTNVTGEFTTGSIKHTLLVGVDLNWNRFEDIVSKVDFTTFTPLDVFNPIYEVISPPDFSTVPNLPVQFDNETNRVGVFLQDQISLTDNLILVAGLRYDNVDSVNTGGQTDVSRSDDAWSPRLGVVYQPTEAISLYGNYSQSFVPNGFVGVDGEFLEPETSEGFEIGVKAELLDGNLLATLAYFDITKQNVATVANPLTGGSVATGEQRSQGIELDISGEILPGWNIIGFYAYTDARVTEDNVIPVGNRLFNAPRHSAGLWTTYEIQKGNLQGLGFGLGVNYVSNRFGNLNNDFEVGDYFLTNAAIFYRRDNWRLAINVNNLFDVEYISSAGSGSSRNLGIIPGAPLSVIGSISVSF